MSDTELSGTASSGTASSDAEFSRIRFDHPADGVARVTLNRPDAANAQDREMLYEIDRAFRRATLDDAVKVIVVAAEGRHFSAGHDLRDRADLADFDTVALQGGFAQPGQHGMMAGEEEIYLGFCWRWRNLPKPTIVAVQGKAIAGGLMLIWPFDIVVAADDATFADPVVAFGVNGHEFFTHVWELGPRKAKELLFRGCSFSAEEMHRLGAVNHVVPRDDLEAETLAIAAEIAEQPALGLKLAKMAVNQSLDAQGQWTAIQAAFGLHHVGHASASIVHGMPIDPSGAERIRRRAKDPAVS
ncbi:MAG: enoyl-CoA hydratase [Actinomycetota bacterium]|nr:enoyl-CoA hydratase [Actinomycetota bacterium]